MLEDVLKDRLVRRNVSYGRNQVEVKQIRRIRKTQPYDSLYSTQ